MNDVFKTKANYMKSWKILIKLIMWPFILYIYLKLQQNDEFVMSCVNLFYL